MIRITNFNVPFHDMSPLPELAARRLNLPPQAVPEVVIVRKAVDARRYHGAPVQFVYVLDVRLSVDEQQVMKKMHKDRNIEQILTEPVRSAVRRVLPATAQRPVVIGFGPAGMFAALTLARTISKGG